MLIELDEEELLKQLARQSKAGKKPAFVYFYTPLCGTCKLARRMLEVVDVALNHLQIYTCNINLMPKQAQIWKITSVPALLVFYGTDVDNQLYRFQSVEHLYAFLKPYAMMGTL